ncbi:MAG: POTRA domain-containing protein [Anaeromyxobacteraceae bacterium]
MSPLALLAALLVGAAPAPGDPPVPPRPVVAEVELRLPPGEDPAVLRPLVAVQAGKPLTSVETRRTVKALYQTGRFANVEVIAFPAGGPADAPRVRVEVRCTPRRLAASVKVEPVAGAELPLPAAQLLLATELPKGAEIYAGRLAAASRAIQSLLARHGWRQALVTPTETGATQVDVLFTVAPGAPTRVASLLLGPDPGLPLESLEKGLGTRVGAILEEDVLEADVRAVRDALRKGGFYRARVAAPRVAVDGQEARVDFPVEAGPHFTFRFTGETRFSPSQLRASLGYEGDVLLDATTLEAAAERLQAFLAAFGYTQARVRTEESGAGSEVTIWFHVVPGRVFWLRDVRFAGASQRDEEWVRRRLAEGFRLAPKVEADQWRADLDSLALRAGLAPVDPAPYLSSDPRLVYNAEAWRFGTQFVAEQYHQDGFLDAAVEVRRLSLDAVSGWIDVDVQVKEGVRTVIEAVEIDGNADVSAENLLRSTRLEPGMALSRSRVAVARQAIQDAYFRTGHIYARIEVSEQFSADRTRARVRFRVEEGPQVRVASVVVEGNKRTRTALIERVVGMKAGEVFDPEAAATAQTDLLRLGVFRSAVVHLADPDLPQESKTVVVTVVEGPWQSVVGTVGLSIAEGPRAGGEYTLRNLFGNALEFSARARANYPLEIFRPDLVVIPPAERLEWLGEIGLRQPRAFGLPAVSLRADLVGQHKIQSSYQLMRGAFILGADLVRLGRFSASLAAQLEVDDVTSRTAYTIIDATNPQEARQVFPVGLTWLFSLQPRLVFDLRDNAARPTFGLYAEVQADFSQSIGTPTTVFRSDTHVNLIRLQGTLTGYVPIWDLVLAVSAQAGRIYALDAQSVTIAPKRFYLGGGTSMRGYGENEMIPQDQRGVVAAQTERCASVLSGLGCSPQLQQLVARGIMLPSQGGQSSVLFRAELRVPMSRATELGFFADLGNLWYDQVLTDLRMIRTNLGFGLRIITPVGPAAFDLGFNLNPEYRINETVFAPHFSVGFF